MGKNDWTEPSGPGAAKTVANKTPTCFPQGRSLLRRSWDRSKSRWRACCRRRLTDGRSRSRMRRQSCLFRSNEVQPPLGGTGAVAVQTRPANDQRVPGRLELVLATDLLDRRLDRWVLELDHLPAHFADQMLVLR